MRRKQLLPNVVAAACQPARLAILDTAEYTKGLVQGNPACHIRQWSTLWSQCECVAIESSSLLATILLNVKCRIERVGW